MRRRLMMLPFAYRLRFVPPKRRNVVDRLVRGDLAVEIRDAEGPEAPVAIRLVRHDAVDKADPDRRAEWYPAGPPVQEFRYLDGVPHVPIQATDGAPLSADAFARSVAKTADDWVRWGLAGPAYREEIGWSGRDYPSMPWYKDGSARGIGSPMELLTAEEFVALSNDSEGRIRVRGDDRAELEPVAADLTRAALTVVDGTMWKAMPGLEPHWEVIEASDGLVRLELIHGRDPLHYVHRFRLDRRDEAKAFAEARSRETGRPFVDSTAEVQITDPSVLRMDEAVETARQILSHADYDASDEGRKAAGIARQIRDGLARMDDMSAAGEAYALLRAGTEGGWVVLGDASGAALGRLAQMAELRAELVRDRPADEEILAGLGPKA
jgi:hypothetical protein